MQTSMAILLTSERCVEHQTAVLQFWSWSSRL